MNFKLTISILLLIILISSCDKKNITKPDNFDDFWKQSLNELNETPLKFEKVLKDSIVEGKKFNLYRIYSFRDIYFYAWISEPLKSGRYPIKIRFSGLSKANNKNDIKNSWFLKQNNFINMLVDIRGQGLSTEQINPKEYLTYMIDDKEKYIYRGAFLDAVRAIDFISKNHMSDGNIIVTGGSQGGSLSIVAAALNNKVTMCIVGFPFLTDITNYDKKKWPMNVIMHHIITQKIDYLKLKNNLSYFDMLNFTDKIKVPVFIRSEEFDEITSVSGAIKLFKKINNQKKLLYIEPCRGHGCSTNSKTANELEKIFINTNLNRN